jgi:hypothetical protein
MTRTAKNGLAVLFAGATLLLAGETIAHARFAGGSSHVAMPTPTGTAKVQARRYGWGYGPGWCYWHPYACRGVGRNR